MRPPFPCKWTTLTPKQTHSLRGWLQGVTATVCVHALLCRFLTAAYLHRQFWEIMKGANDKIQRSLSQQRSARWQAVAAEIAENNMEKAQMRSVRVCLPND